MGKVRSILITGATGFIGRATVEAALAEGIEVTAVTRGAAPDAWARRVTVLTCDLTENGAAEKLASAMDDVDAVIHAAAHLGDDPEAHARDTLTGTETVLAAMRRAGVKRLALVSSIAVYDYGRLRAWSEVTEQTPMESAATARDAYVRGKLMQETLAQDAADRQGLLLCILRPGIVYGPGRTWNAHLGVGIGPVLIRTGGRGELPMAHVDHTARALVAAVRSGCDGVLNVVDDTRPKRGRFLAAHRKSGWPKLVVPLPWRLLWLAGLLIAPLTDKAPGLLRPRILKSRMMPLRYPDDALKKLGLPPSGAFEDLMADALRRGRR